MSGGSEEPGVSFTRRDYLTVLGSAAAVGIGATQVVSADDHGYGTSEYGAGPYGGSSEQTDGSEQEEDDSGSDSEETDDSEEESEEQEAVPEIESLTAEDVSNPRNPHVDAEISWEASIDDSELYAAQLTLSDQDRELETWSYDLSGQTAAETETRRIPHRAREADTEYTADLVVYSYYGQTDRQTITFTSQ